MRSPSVTTMSFAAMRPIGEQLGDAPAVICADEHSARSLKDLAEPLAREADCRGINQWLNLVDVLAHDPKKQRLVAVVKRVERYVFLKVVWQSPQVLQHPLRLLVQRKHVCRQQPAQTEGLTLLLREGGSLVEQRVAQQRHSARRMRSDRLGSSALRHVYFALQGLSITPISLHCEEQY